MLQDSFTQQVSCRTYVETPHRVNLLSNLEKHHFGWPKICLKQIAGCYAYQPNMGEVRWGLWSQKQSCSFSACSVGSLEKTNMIWVFSTFQWQWGWRRIQIQSWNFFGSSLPQQSSTQSLHRNFPMDQLHVITCVKLCDCISPRCMATWASWIIQLPTRGWMHFPDIAMRPMLRVDARFFVQSWSQAQSSRLGKPCMAPQPQT